MTLKWQPNRRDFLKASVSTAALVHYPLAAKQSSTEVPLDDYQPLFFTPEEWRFIMAACDRLIPADGEGPGALEARVPVFIDLQLNGDFGNATTWYMEGPHDPNAELARGFQSPLTPAQIYQDAIKAVNEWCNTQHNSIFSKLNPETQDQVLTALQKNEIPLKPEVKEFFSFLLQNTKEGYFADPMYGGNHEMAAWTYIGFPGARASFTEWVDQHNVAYPLGAVSISGKRT